MPYMLPFEQVFVEVSHFMWAFSHEDLVVGVLSAASPGAAKEAARPKATVYSSTFPPGSTALLAALGERSNRQTKPVTN
jgi:hypothetical protein